MSKMQTEPTPDGKTATLGDHPHPDVQPTHHLLIAGTGRAGTSFLVKYLAAAGLETHLQFRKGKPDWFDEVNAGLEDLPISRVSGPLPYVVKSATAAEVIDDVLTDPAIALDAVIIPIRDLMEAASSRVITELAALHRQHPWMTELSKTWGAHGKVPAGVVYSLEPLDQARVLAVSFHHLVERLTAADIPLVFLTFPRMIADEAYLWTRLEPILGVRIDRERARAAHAEVAELSKVRTGDELAASRAVEQAHGDEAHINEANVDLGALDRVALARELKRLRGNAETMVADAHGLQARIESEASENARLTALCEAQTATTQELMARLEAAEAKGHAAETALDAIASRPPWRSTAALRALVQRLRPRQKRA